MATKSKNLIVVMSDEHSSRFLGCAGHPTVKTPHLDKLAASGTRYRNCYTPSPICVPARAAFATGRYVHQIRHWDNAMPYTGAERGWGHELQAAGIRVESIGKLHYRQTEDPAGFDVEHIPMHVAGGHGMVWASIRDPFMNAKERDPNARMLGKNIGGGESNYTEYDRSVTARTVEWLHEVANRNTEPFVLYVGLVAPHFPLTCPQAFYDLYPHDQLLEVKQHPDSGYRRHPWVEEQNAMMDSEASFTDPQERLAAIAAYHGLVSWVDHNVGQIVEAMQQTGLSDNTRLIYTSDHGDNVGARGLWGKSNMYEESAAVPMIFSGPGVPAGVCDTPVDLLDLYPTILDSAGVDHIALMDNRRGQPLLQLAAEPHNPDRIIFSEYHAAGSNTGAFMLRRGDWKLIYYVRHQPELFNLANDPEELTDLAGQAAYQEILYHLIGELKNICDPEQTDLLAKSDQQALIDSHGGREAAMQLGAPGATPPPQV